MDCDGEEPRAGLRVRAWTVRACGAPRRRGKRVRTRGADLTMDHRERPGPWAGAEIHAGQRGACGRSCDGGAGFSRGSHESDSNVRLRSTARTNEMSIQGRQAWTVRSSSGPENSGSPHWRSKIRSQVARMREGVSSPRSSVSLISSASCTARGVVRVVAGNFRERRRLRGEGRFGEGLARGFHCSVGRLGAGGAPVGRLETGGTRRKMGRGLPVETLKFG